MNENNKNNGLNEFNKRNIEGRNRRERRRKLQKIAVLVIYTLIIAVLAAVLWLAILEIKDNVSNIKLPDTLPILTDGNGVTTPLVTDPSGTTTTTNSSVTTTQDTGTTTAAPSFKVVYKNFKIADMQTGTLILVNNEHPFNEPDNMASKLNRIAAYKPAESKALYFQGTGVQLLPAVSIKLYEMADANYAAIKINDLCVASNGAYRTFDQQQELYNKNSSKLPGGCSDFNTGLTVNLVAYTDDLKVYDFDDPNYANGAKFTQWFEENAYKYGFIRRFTNDKMSITGQPDTSGMFRYVGYIHAYNMKQQGLCLEEYLNAISKYTYEGQHYTVTADDGNKYEIYYVPSTGNTTSVPVPESLPYEISGDNIGGYIVTVTLD